MYIFVWATLLIINYSIKNVNLNSKSHRLLLKQIIFF